MTQKKKKKTKTPMAKVPPEEVWTSARKLLEIAFLYEKQSTDPHSVEDKTLLPIIRSLRSLLAKREKALASSFTKVMRVGKVKHIAAIFEKILNGEISPIHARNKLLFMLRDLDSGKDSSNSFVAPTKAQLEQYNGPKEAAVAWFADYWDFSERTFYDHQKRNKKGSLKFSGKDSLLIVGHYDEFLKIVLRSALGLGESELKSFLKIGYNRFFNLLADGTKEMPNQNSAHRYSS